MMRLKHKTCFVKPIAQRPSADITDEDNKGKSQIEFKMERVLGKGV